MASASKTRPIRYPTSDGKPMAETPQHRIILTDSIAVLGERFLSDPLAYVSGNMMMYYVPGNKRKHVAPDVFVTFGIPKLPERRYYLVWEEGKGPDVVIEGTSKSTKNEDLKTKFVLYRDILRVQEYFLFDPFEEYLNPPLQGFRLQDGEYVRIEPVGGRLLSEVLGLLLGREGETLRFYDPVTGERLLTPREQAARNAEEAARQKAEAQRHAELAARNAELAARGVEELSRERQDAMRNVEKIARLEAELARQREELLRKTEEAARTLDAVIRLTDALRDANDLIERLRGQSEQGS